MNEKNVFETTKNDLLHLVTKTGLSTIPVVGSALAEVFDAIFTSPLSKRKDQWLVEISQKLLELEDKIKDFKIASLSDNELFITYFTNASQAAIRNHQQEKLDSLRNSTLRVAIQKDIDDDIAMIYFRMIEELTPYHIRVLSFLHNPTNWFIINEKRYEEPYMGSISQILLQAFPELRGQDEFVNKVIHDLYNEGFINTESIKVMMTGSGIMSSRTTNLGKGFIEFISKVDI